MGKSVCMLSEKNPAKKATKWSNPTTKNTTKSNYELSVRWNFIDILMCDDGHQRFKRIWALNLSLNIFFKLCKIWLGFSSSSLVHIEWSTLCIWSDSLDF